MNKEPVFIRFKDAVTEMSGYVLLEQVSAFTKNPLRPWWNLITKNGSNYFISDDNAANVQAVLDAHLFAFKKPLDTTPAQETENDDA